MRTWGVVAAASLLALAGAGSCGDEPAATTTSATPSGTGGGGAGGEGGGAGGGIVDWPATAMPDVVSLAGDIVRERMLVEGFVPGPNPTTGEGTPPEHDATPVLRFRREPARDVRAVVLALPGFLAGAGSLEPLAVSILERATSAGIDVEVWAIDRRSNGLEDVAGMLAAEAAQNAEVARGYYYGTDLVGGEPFAGFATHGDASYASEWGLETHAEDYRNVIRLIDAADRRGHVVLLGHSLGAWMSEVIAGWRFPDGVRGFDELAGVVMIDGVLLGAPVSESQYHDGFFGPGLDVPGLDAIRASSALVAVEDVTPSAWSEIAALRARFAREEIVDDPERDAILASYLGLAADAVPTMTNAAALGFSYDFEYRPNEAVTFGLGHTDGPTEDYQAQSPFGMVTVARPSDPTATYGWIDAADVSPPEAVPLHALAEAWSRGGVNGVEWYFPFRLLLDLYATRGSAVPEDGYQADEGLRAFDGPLDDAPFMVVASTFPASTFDPVAARIAPVVGPGRPQAGADRSTPEGFEVVVAPMLHAETTMAAHDVGNPIADEVVGFITLHTEPATITITPP